jgi:putative endonuclease
MIWGAISKGPNRKIRPFSFDGSIMPYWVYILQNEATGKLYKGQTSDLERRLDRHNTHESGSMRYTYKQKGTWRLIHSEKHATRSDAMKREKFLKSGQGREWIRDNILNQ